jgi:NitT/TauT family transport system substrate-binding protein
MDALSQFDTQYTLSENAGVKLRVLDKRLIERFPSNGFIALEETIQARAKELTGFARVREGHDLHGRKSRGRRPHAARDVHVLRARLPQLKLEPSGMHRWGKTNEANLRKYTAPRA